MGCLLALRSKIEISGCAYELLLAELKYGTETTAPLLTSAAILYGHFCVKYSPEKYNSYVNYAHKHSCNLLIYNITL